MLLETEKRGIAELLERMDHGDLYSLAQTVTNRLILPESAVEAIQAIILHTDKAVDLLRRRKVRKEFLFRYLHDKKVPIEASADKGAIAQKVLQVWGSADEFDMFIFDEASVDAPPPAPVPSRNASHSSLNSLDCFSAGSVTVNSFRPESNLRRTESSVSIMNLDECSNSSFTFGSNSGPPDAASLAFHGPPDAASLAFLGPLDAASLTFQSSSASSNFTQSHCQEMANDFVKWFYEIFNTCHHSEAVEFNPSMFWPDASAKVNLLGVNGETIESFQVEENSSNVCDMMKDVVRRHGLQFNPNLCEEGVRGRLDPHGLVLVLSCGTLHNQHTVCGVFEQVFGLIRDPSSENNWKIKQTEARLFAKTVNEEPSLANSSLCAIAYS